MLGSLRAFLLNMMTTWASLAVTGGLGVGMIWPAAVTPSPPASEPTPTPPVEAEPIPALPPVVLPAHLLPASPRLPEGVNWTSGQILVLLIAPSDTFNWTQRDGNHVKKAFANLDQTRRGRLVGGKPFVVGKTRLCESLPPTDSQTRIPQDFNPGEHEQAFDLLREDIESVRRLRNAPMRVVVVLIAANAPGGRESYTPVNLAQITNTELEWFGATTAMQLTNNNPVLNRYFGSSWQGFGQSLETLDRTLELCLSLGDR